MTANHHIIKRQLLELKVPRRSDALNLQMQISSLFKDIVADQLAARFDALGLENAILRIPKLEVNLGVINPHYLERDFVESCVRAIEKEVDRIFHLARIQLQTSASVTSSTDEEAVIISATRHQLEALEYFLKTGTLIPPFHELPWEQLEETWLEALEKDAKQAILLLRHKLVSKPLAMERLLKQWSLKGLGKLLILIRTASQGRAVTEASGIFTDSALKNQISLITGWPLAVWRQLPDKILQILKAWAQQADRVEKLKTSYSVQLDTQVQLLNIILTRPSAQWTERVESVLEDHTKGGNSTASEKNITPESKAVEPNEETEQDRIFDEHNKQAIDNAGLVILHPFLPALFGHLEWLNGKLWKDKASQERALHLLHYLVSGEENGGEHQMYLAKLLCEWPSNWAVDRTLVLSVHEKKEADELLEAVLQHWSALKSTSVELLRDGFLHRPGLLHKRDRGWLLQVERKGQDLLLDKLPWGIGLIRLPWMKGELVVEW